MELEYDANKNTEIFQQLCQLDLKQVIVQVPADSCCLSFMTSAVCLLALIKRAIISACAACDEASVSTACCMLLGRAKQHWNNRLSRLLQP